MARYGRETTLAPGAVLRLARARFGPGGELGLAIAREGLGTVAFEGGGGGIEITATPRIGALRVTDVTILSREFDPWAERFLGELGDAERGPGPLRRLARWFGRGA